MKVNILGTEYDIKVRSPKDDPKLENNWGYNEETTKPDCIEVKALVSAKDKKVKILSIEEVKSNENDKSSTNEG